MVNMYEWEILKEVLPHGIPGWEKPRQGAFGGSGPFSTQMAFPPDFRFTGVQTPKVEGAMHSLDLDDGTSGSIGAMAQWKQNRQMREAYKQQQKYLEGLAASGAPLPPGFAQRGKTAKDLVRRKDNPYVLYTDRGPMPIGPGGARGPKTHRLGDFAENVLSRTMPWFHGPSIRERQMRTMESKADQDALAMWLHRSEIAAKAGHSYSVPDKDVSRLVNILARRGFDQKHIRNLLREGPGYFDRLSEIGAKRAANQGKKGDTTVDTTVDTTPVRDIPAYREGIEGDELRQLNTTLGGILYRKEWDKMGTGSAMGWHWFQENLNNNPEWKKILDNEGHDLHEHLIEGIQQLNNYRGENPEFDEEAKKVIRADPFDPKGEWEICPDCKNPRKDENYDGWCDICDPDGFGRRLALERQRGNDLSTEERDNWYSENIKPEDMGFFSQINPNTDAGKRVLKTLIDIAKPYWDSSVKERVDYRGGDPINWLLNHDSMKSANFDSKAKSVLHRIIKQYQNPRTDSDRKFPQGHPQVGKKMGEDGLKAEAKAWLSLWMQMLAGPNPKGGNHWDEFEKAKEKELGSHDDGLNTVFGETETNPDNSGLFTESSDEPFKSAWSILKIGA